MADYNLVIPDEVVPLFTEAFVEYLRTGGTDTFDAWAIKSLGQSLIGYLQQAQVQHLMDAYTAAGIGL